MIVKLAKVIIVTIVMNQVLVQVFQIHLLKTQSNRQRILMQINFAQVLGFLKMHILKIIIIIRTVILINMKSSILVVIKKLRNVS